MRQCTSAHVRAPLATPSSPGEGYVEPTHKVADVPPLSPAEARVLFDRLKLPTPVRCVDVGAMALAHQDPWTRFAELGCTEVVGFEPNDTECQKLQQQGLKGHTFLPIAIGNGDESTLHITNTAMTSSLLEPALETMGMFQNLAELCQVVKKDVISTTRLDEIAEVANVDFLKLDIQGGELMALSHASQTLASVVMVQTEVEFVEIYRDQPLFADVDALLRREGFIFHHFTYLSGRPYKLHSCSRPDRQASQQVLWGDAVYVRDPLQCSGLSSDKLKAMAFGLSAFYQAHDLALHMLERLDQREGSQLAPAVSKLLSSLASQTPTAKAAAQPPADVALPLANGLKLMVPNNIELITPYVVAERGGWFEDELPLLSQLLQPGQTAVDIGANYGLYTLALAQAVGPQGRVHAFEPASRTAALLAATLKLNQLETRVQLHQQALSDAAGHGRLSLHQQSELNALQEDMADAASVGSGAMSSEAVAVESLDNLFGLDETAAPVAFVKMDAEGQESAILRGGRGFLERHSPLVMFEVRAGNDLHLHLIDEFEALGFRCFQLVPGLNLLAPLQSPPALDPYTLNLFACRPDRQLELEQRQLLIPLRSEQADPLPAPLSQQTLADALGHPYAQLLAAHWQRNSTHAEPTELNQALRLFLASQLGNRNARSRLADLEAAHQQLAGLVEQRGTPPRLLSFARTALALGHRTLAVKTLADLVRQIEKDGKVDVAEPFLLPCRRYESLSPRPEQIGRFVHAAAVEALNDSASYSSFYSPKPSLARLSLIQQLGFADQRVQNSIQLIRRRLAAAASRQPG